MVTAAPVAAGSVADTAVTGLLAFLIVAVMGLALYFLLRSMNKQLRKVAPPPPAKPGAGRPAKAGQAASGEHGPAGNGQDRQ